MDIKLTKKATVINKKIGPLEIELCKSKSTEIEYTQIT